MCMDTGEAGCRCDEQTVIRCRQGAQIMGAVITPSYVMSCVIPHDSYVMCIGCVCMRVNTKENCFVVRMFVKGYKRLVTNLCSSVYL